jgi:hypothetical protein
MHFRIVSPQALERRVKAIQDMNLGSGGLTETTAAAVPSDFTIQTVISWRSIMRKRNMSRRRSLSRR